MSAILAVCLHRAQDLSFRREWNRRQRSMEQQCIRTILYAIN